MGRRNAICRLFRAKSDKRRIDAWRLDLDGILRVFEVRSVTPKWPSLTFCFQIELATHTNAAVPDAPRDVSNTTTLTSEVHHNTLKGPNDVDGKGRVASILHIMAVAE